MAKVISFLNYKGGVGKTTTTYHIGASLAEHHRKRVLLIDIDPQTNLTFLCAPIERWEAFKRKNGTVASMYKRFVANKPLEIAKHTWSTPGGRHDVDLIPCDIDLLGEDIGGQGVGGTYSSLEQMRRQAQAYLKERRFLKQVVDGVADRYDYILIDCPPNLYLMTQNALLASDHYVVPAIPDYLSTIGLNILIRKVGDIDKYVQSANTFAGRGADSMAKFGGVVWVKVRLGGTMITVRHSTTMQDVESSLGDGSCFGVHTTEMIGYSDAAESFIPIWETITTNGRRAASKHEYEAITNEFTRRFP